MNILLILRYFIWAIIFEHVLKYYLYSSALLNYPWKLSELDNWAVAGFGYSLMLMFFCKYFILYGMTNSIGQFDGLQGKTLEHSSQVLVFAPPPQCIAHMNKTSYLWRNFDQGLYAFLMK